MRKMSPETVPPKQAAAELGITLPTLYYKMQTGLINIGHAWKRQGATRWGYDIYRKLLDKEKKKLGIEGRRNEDS